MVSKPIAGILIGENGKHAVIVDVDSLSILLETFTYYCASLVLPFNNIVAGIVYGTQVKTTSFPPSRDSQIELSGKDHSISWTEPTTRKPTFTTVDFGFRDAESLCFVSRNTQTTFLTRFTWVIANLVADVIFNACSFYAIDRYDRFFIGSKPTYPQKNGIESQTTRDPTVLRSWQELAEIHHYGVNLQKLLQIGQFVNGSFGVGTLLC